MIRHVVTFKVKEGTNPEQVEEVLRRLAELPGLVASVRASTFGRDIGVNEGNEDLALATDFDDEAGYLLYRDHPAHLAFVAECSRPFLERRSAVQFAWPA